MSQIALLNGRLVDGTGREPVDPATLIVDGPILRAVGSANAICLPESCRQIDLHGATVLPAFIDGHMHVSVEPGRLDPTGHVWANLKAVGTLQECLRWGTGTVGHAAGSPENVFLRNLIRQGHVKGCSDLLVGAVVTATCTHKYCIRPRRCQIGEFTW